jgi:HprK-related kinase A
LKVADHSLSELSELLATNGLFLPCGPFAVRITSNLSTVASGLHRLYADFPLLGSDQFADFEVRVMAPSILRRYWRPKVILSCDGRTPFKPLPIDQAFPMLEWGLNWILTSHAHNYLIMHAAVVERDGRALLLAADPGSGKSTLCAALVHHGWRLLSDELALISLIDGSILPIARPISLKNQSIDIIGALGHDVVLGQVCQNTVKGSIAHMKPPAASVAALGIASRPSVIVFPRYEAGSELVSESEGEARAFVELVRHSFNFPLLTGEGFDAIDQMLDTVKVMRLQYSSLDQALPEIERLWRYAE